MTQATIQAAAMRKAMKFVMMAHERRNIIPIIGMVRLTAEDGRITATVTDLDIWAEASAEAETDGRLDVMLSPRLLNDMLRYADGAVTVAHVGQTVTITAGDVTATVQIVCPAEDFQPFVAGQDAGEQVIPAALLRKTLAAVKPCISTEETRYYLNGAYLHAHDGNLRAVATDGRRLAMYDAPNAWVAPNAILPTQAVSMLTRHITAKDGGSVTVRHSLVPQKPTKDPKTGEVVNHPPLVRLEFIGADWALRCRTIDGTYPTYTRAIPEPADAISFTLSHAQLRRFSAARDAYVIKIEPDAGRMAQRDSDGSVVSMPVQGRGATCGANLRYLMAFARQSGTIRLESKGPMEPFRVITDDPALLQVLMPMKVV